MATLTRETWTAPRLQRGEARRWFKATYGLRGTLWIVIYLFFILAPLFALLLGAWPPHRGFGTELSVAFGYAGLAMMGLQFGLTARFRFVTEPWGEDVIYHFHRQISLVAVALVVAHPIILFIVRPELIALLNSFTAPWRARFAALSTYSLIALVVMAIWRAKLKLSYEAWHVTHVVLALLAVGAGVLHMIGWSFYLQDPWKRGLWIGLTLFWIALLVYVRLIKPWFILRRPYRVREVRAERGDSFTLVMQPEGHPGMQFSPGQFAWLTVYGSPFKISAHPFSISSSAAATDGSVELTIRKLGDFTNDIDRVPEGRRVFLDGPYGAFTMGDPSDVHVLIAGGVGITPMMSMLRTLADRGDKRPIVLLYGSRDWESVTFREELESLKSRLALTVVHVLSQPPEGWTGEKGYVDADLLRRHLPRPYVEHDYFICGPDLMMDAVEKALGQMGVPIHKYHSERYSFV
ncbi:MAG: ferric reductase-like transmembrane domain-containing protein [Deltaproteobacteria bacterium]|nr:ferric reductase-like transmembrane domain-containing protein [Deltaproteobacteria bacterium]